MSPICLNLIRIAVFVSDGKSVALTYQIVEIVVEYLGLDQRGGGGEVGHQEGAAKRKHRKYHVLSLFGKPNQVPPEPPVLHREVGERVLRHELQAVLCVSAAVVAAGGLVDVLAGGDADAHDGVVVALEVLLAGAGADAAAAAVVVAAAAAVVRGPPGKDAAQLQLKVVLQARLHVELWTIENDLFEAYPGQ